MEIVLVLAMISVSSAIGTALWGPRARARRRLARAGRELVDGEIVSITGVVRDLGTTLEAPLSGKRCILYDAVARIRSAPSVTREPRKLLDVLVIHEMVSFDLETARGVVRVEGIRADLELPHSSIIPRSIDRETAFMIKGEADPHNLRWSEFDEAVVEPGARVMVQGMVVVGVDASNETERGFRDEPPRKYRIVGHPDHPLTIGRPR